MIKRNLKGNLVRVRQIKYFTLIELLVVIAIIGILAAMLLPALNSSKNLAQRTFCANNQKQIGVLIAMYADGYDSMYPSLTSKQNSTPGSSPWVDLGWYKKIELLAYNKSGKALLFCPTNKESNPNVYSYWRDGYISYGFNFTYLNAYKTASVRKPSETLLLSDTALSNGRGYYWNYTWSDSLWPIVSNRHTKSSNILWCDGHVEALTAAYPAQFYKVTKLGSKFSTESQGNKWNRE